MVVRPEPGNTATADRLRAAGHDVIAQPLFAVVPVAWTPPDPAGFDALLLTSANALRHGGDGLAALASLPVIAVGQATAASARAAGFVVAAIGDGDAAAAVALAGAHRLLHLAGRHHRSVGVEETIVVYASGPVPIDPATVSAWQHRTILLHSSRAARRVAALVDRRNSIRLVALSEPVHAAAGTGWRSTAIAAAPTEASLLDEAVRRAD